MRAKSPLARSPVAVDAVLLCEVLGLRRKVRGGRELAAADIVRRHDAAQLANLIGGRGASQPSACPRRASPGRARRASTRTFSDAGAAMVMLDVDLPEIEDMPTNVLTPLFLSVVGYYGPRLYFLSSRSNRKSARAPACINGKPE